MKVPLRYQASEFDCGPTALINAISYLYDSEEIPPDFVKRIYDFSLDDYLTGRAYHSGTTMQSMRYAADWFGRYAAGTGFPIRTAFCAGEQVHLREDSPILSCLREGGAVVIRVILECDHYVTLTGLDGTYLEVFDPYYMDEPILPEGVLAVSGEEKRMNRKVPIAVMDSESRGDYAFCSPGDRCAVLIYRTQEEKIQLPGWEGFDASGLLQPRDS